MQVNYGNVIREVQMEEDEVKYMNDLLNNGPDDLKMTEWGCGGSTCVWLDNKKINQKLITIEHNEDWFNRVNRAIKNHFNTDVTNNFTFLHIPEEGEFEHGYGNIIEEHPVGLKKYINPTEDIWDSDIFFIDGIARATCAMMVLFKHTKENPAIFIHDHIGREIWYDWATQFYRIENVATTLSRLHKI
jgi:hypothetical protein